MKLHDLKERISSLTQDVEFSHNSMTYLVVPYNAKKYVLLSEDRFGKELECNSIDMLFCFPFFDGKALRDIMNDVNLI